MKSPIPSAPLGRFLVRATIVFALFALRSTSTAAPALPTIPNQVFNITTYGAVGDGATDDTSAIQSALNACSAAGGGTVLVPAGTFLCGPLTFPSSTNLLVAHAAILRMLPYGTYPGSSPYQTFLGGTNIHDVEISGTGTIDGQGSAWWTAYKADGTLKRPALIRFDGCTRVAIVGVTLLNAPNVHITLGKNSTDGTITGVTVSAPSTSPNTDGIDVWSPNVAISHCDISCGDDNIAMDSGTSPIWISNCAFGAGHGCSIGSYTGGGMSGIYVDSCTFNGTTSGIRMKSNRTRGGIVQNCFYSNITMTNVPKPIFICSYYPDNTIPADPSTDPAQTITSTTPFWQNITIRNLTATGAAQCGTVYGLPEAVVGNLTLDHVVISGTTGFTLNHAQGVVFTNGTTFTASGGASLTTYDAAYATQTKVATPTFGLAGGTYTGVQTVTISTATAGSTIRYTTDGSTPTSTTGTVYSGPITVSANTTINAVAYQSGMVTSDVASAKYAIISATYLVPSQYSTVQAAVDAAPSNSTTTTMIQIATGTYNEAVLVPSGKNNLIFLGQPDRSQVVITNAVLNSTNGYTGALQLRGNDITVENLTLQNTAGVAAGPANALFTSGQRLAFRNVAVLGWQDTAAIWDNTLAYFTGCEIDGSVDFIYSGGTAFFANCTVRQIRTTSPYGGVNAAPSTPLNTRGFVLSNCVVTRAPGVPDTSSTLMRPWGNFGESAYLDCDMDAHISAAGWSAWGGRELTCRAAEYGSTTLSGAAIDLSTRASWADTTISGILSAYSRNAVLAGWNPDAGAPAFQIYAVNSGGAATGRFAADAYYSGGSSYSTTATIDTSAATNPAPQAVYQSERHGSAGFTYTLPGLTPGQGYTVRLHFAEIYWSSAGSRLFNVAINGTTVLSSFDIYAAAGAKNKAIVKEFTAYANGSGQIVIAFTTVKDGAKVSGLELVQ